MPPARLCALGLCISLTRDLLEPRASSTGLRADEITWQPRTLFLRSVDAALECMLIYFGMESTYLYDSEVAGKRLL